MEGFAPTVAKTQQTPFPARGAGERWMNWVIERVVYASLRGIRGRSAARQALHCVQWRCGVPAGTEESGNRERVLALALLEEEAFIRSQLTVAESDYRDSVFAGQICPGRYQGQSHGGSGPVVPL